MSGVRCASHAVAARVRRHCKPADQQADGRTDTRPNPRRLRTGAERRRAAQRSSRPNGLSVKTRREENEKGGAECGRGPAGRQRPFAGGTGGRAAHRAGWPLRCHGNRIALNQQTPPPPLRTARPCPTLMTCRPRGRARKRKQAASRYRRPASKPWPRPWPAATPRRRTPASHRRGRTDRQTRVVTCAL